MPIDIDMRTVGRQDGKFGRWFRAGTSLLQPVYQSGYQPGRFTSGDLFLQLFEISSVQRIKSVIQAFCLSAVPSRNRVTIPVI